MFGTALIFGAFLTLCWSLSVWVAYLHGIHPLPEALFKFVTKVEVGLVYGDAVFCAIVLLVGTWRSLKELL